MRGNKQDPGWFVCQCAEGCVRRSKPIQQSALPVSSVETETRRITRAVRKKSQGINPLTLYVQLQNLSAVFSLTDPGGGHTRASPHPLPSTRQTPIHPATDCLSECYCCRCIHGRVLPLPDFQADLNSTSVVLLQKTNTLMSLAFRKAWSSIAEAHLSAFTFCVNGAQKERQPRTTAR